VRFLRLTAALPSANDTAFAQQVRAFLDTVPLPELAGNTVEKVEVRTITMVQSAGCTRVIRAAWPLAGANSQLVPITHGNTMRQAHLSCVGGKGLLVLAAPGSHQLLGARFSRCANTAPHLLPRWLLAPPTTQERLAQRCLLAHPRLSCSMSGASQVAWTSQPVHEVTHSDLPSPAPFGKVEHAQRLGVTSGWHNAQVHPPDLFGPTLAVAIPSSCPLLPSFLAAFLLPTPTAPCMLLP
jgi:hypothetical protein